jgi:HSP20 family molecular chaperone IbpA
MGFGGRSATGRAVELVGRPRVGVVPPRVAGPAAAAVHDRAAGGVRAATGSSYRLGGGTRACDPARMDFVERSALRSLLASSADACAQGCWRPAVDVYRQPDGWLCKFDLAGVAPEDVEVRACGHRLKVAGVRRDRTIGSGCEAWSMEIAYHRFERMVELPCDLQHCRIRCAMEHGMLLVSVAEDGR